MLKITECGIEYKIEYNNDDVRNMLLRHIERLQARIDNDGLTQELRSAVTDAGLAALTPLDTGSDK